MAPSKIPSRHPGWGIFFACQAFHPLDRQPIFTEMPTIHAIEARLHVADVARSVAFYRSILGFAIETLWPEESPQLAILSRDRVRLQLGSHTGTPGAAQHSGCTLWLDVEALSDLYASVSEKVGVEWGPEVYFYGRREFAFRDPDGHLIIVSEVTHDPPTCDQA
jgi:catechol 2,3-dioxygenase-like lactoylglutathione lyase family enzyme